MTTLLTPPVNNRFTIVDTLGIGSQAQVYLVRDEALAGAPRRALKLLKDAFGPKDLTRLRLEFARLSAMVHPCLPAVHDLDVVERGPDAIPLHRLFLVSDLVEGRPLDQGLPDSMNEGDRIEALWSILFQVGSVLDLLAAHRIVHGDISPSNLVLDTEGRVRLLDFGLSTLIGRSNRQPDLLAAAATAGEPSVSVGPAGTIPFMAPEQITGRQDARSDLYSLGATVSWLATGRFVRVPQGASMTEALASLLYEDAAPIQTLAPWVPDELAEIVDRLVARQPDERYPSAASLLTHVERFSRSRPIWLPARRRAEARLLRPVLCGRDRELKALFDFIAADRPIGPGILSVTGPAGSGRRRLIQEALTQLRLISARPTDGQVADRAIRPTVFEGTWQDLVRFVQARRGSAAKRIENLSTSALYESMVQSIEEMASHRPVVLAIRDGNEEMVEGFGKHIGRVPTRRLAGVTIIVRRKVTMGRQQRKSTGRPPNQTEPDSSGIRANIRLGALSKKQAAALLQSAMGRSPGRAFLDRVHKTTKGWPGPMLDLCRAAWTEVRHREAIDQVLLKDLPLDNLSGLFRSGINALSRSAKTLLRAVVIWDGRGDLPRLARTLGLQPKTFARALDELLRSDLIEQHGDGFAVAHPVIGDVAIEEAAPKTIQALRNKVLKICRDEATHRPKSDGPADRDLLLSARLAVACHQPILAWQTATQAARACRAHLDIPNTIQATDLALSVAPQAPHEQRRPFMLWAANLHVEMGRYDRALDLARSLTDGEPAMKAWAGSAQKRVDVQAGNDDRDIGLSAQIVIATCHRRQGRFEQAAQAAQTAMNQAAHHSVLWRKAAALQTRVLIDMGRIDAAIDATKEQKTVPSGAERVSSDAPDTWSNASTGPRSDAPRPSSNTRGEWSNAQGSWSETGTLATDQAEAWVEWLEAAGLARHYHGDQASALHLFQQAQVLAEPLPPHVQARIVDLQGLVLHSTGHLTASEPWYRRAIHLAHLAGDVHARAHYQANLGANLFDQGKLTAAIPPLTSAARTMRRLGHTAQIPGILYNLANTLLGLGDLAGACREAEVTLGEATTASSALSQAHALLLAAHVTAKVLESGRQDARRLLATHGLDPDPVTVAVSAIQAFERAQADLENAQAALLIAVAAAAASSKRNLAMADSGVSLRRSIVAKTTATPVRKQQNDALTPSLPTAGMPPHGDQALAAMIRSAAADLWNAVQTHNDATSRGSAAHALATWLAAALNVPDTQGESQAAPVAIPPTLSVTRLAILGLEATRGLLDSGYREQAWRLATRIAVIAPTALGTVATHLAHETWWAIQEETDEPYRKHRRLDPASKLLLERFDSTTASNHPMEGRTMSPPSDSFSNPEFRTNEAGNRGDREPAGEASRLHRMLEINKRLASEHRIEPLLDLILDSVIDLTGAERGFVLLEETDGLKVETQRNMNAQSQDEHIKWSRSIARQAMEHLAPVLTVDASSDRRFSDAASVMDLKLRSVLAVPLILRGEAVGTLYVDNRMRRGAFRQADAELAMDFADQAAVAIDNARLVTEAHARQEEIERLNHRLRRELDQQEAAVAEMKSEIASSRRAMQVRFDYSNIVGTSPAMMRIFHLLDRITDTDLPVVILGESGTGKELVARAIHFNGPRAAGPFATENCGAVTETLLESLLFGHERGAFTGATRLQKGLFEIADGGTLLLDEVGEMSPAMQVKLLRALQEGEFRRVGGSHPIKVDVRVLASSNQNLAKLLEEGRFRQDLFYRLNVVTITLPPLRDRREDVVALVEHFCRKYEPPGRTVRMSPEAMQILTACPWPGNVRQLENEIMRAAVLCDGVILPSDLSVQVTAAETTADPTTDDLNLKRRVPKLERTLIRAALDRTNGNHTKAAELLGLSRYGLIKKMKRLDIGKAAPDRQPR